MIHIVNPQTSEILDYITLDNIIDDTHKKSLESYIETYDAIVLGGNDFSYDKHLEKRNHIIIPDEDGTYQEFILFEVDKYRDTEGRKTHFYAHATYLELKKAKVIYPTRREGFTLSQHAGWALNNTGWRVGIVESEGVRTFNIENHTNPYEFLKRLANEFEVEIRFRVEHDGRRITARYVDFLERIGDWKGREVEFGKDLDSIRRVEKQDIVTALLGLGPERDDGTRLEVLVTDEEALQRWGRVDEHGNLHHLIEPYEIQSERTEMTEEEARQYTRTALDKRINTQVTYETTILDLEEVPGLEHEKIRFGDTIRIKDTYFNPPLYIEARVFEMERSIKNREKKEIKLGDYIEYTEEEVDAIWNQLRNEIRRRLDRIAIVSINSSAGNVFKNAQGETELTARTFVNGAERDEDGTLYDYQWMRFDKDGNHDTNFYAEGKTITVKASDIDEKATYRVLVAYELEVINTAEITISNVFDGEDGEPGPPGPNRVDENTEFGEGYNPIEKATPEDIEEAIDNLEIGGRNLLKNSRLIEERHWGSDHSTSSQYHSSDGGYREFTSVRDNANAYIWLVYTGHLDLDKIELNQEYTLSADIIGESGLQFGLRSRSDEGHEFFYKTHNNTNTQSWTRVHTTFKFTRSFTDVLLVVIIPTTEHTLKIRNIKIEKGNKATDWTRADEDVQEQIEEAKQTAQQAQTTADSKNTVFRQSSQPSTSGRKIGDVWFDTSRDNLMHVFNGTQWVEAKWGERSLAAESVTALHIKSLEGLNVNDQFIVDSSGNVKFAGHLEGASGSFISEGERDGIHSRIDIENGFIQIEDSNGTTVIGPWFMEQYYKSHDAFYSYSRGNVYMRNNKDDSYAYISVDRYGFIRIYSSVPNSPLYITMPGGVYIDGGLQISHIEQVLWTGQAYPLDTQTIRPSKALSDCMTGWILRFQRYIVGTGIQENNFHYVHIPKTHALFKEGAGIRITLGEDTDQTVTKYIYVYNDRIVGHASNNQNRAQNRVLTGVFEY